MAEPRVPRKKESVDTAPKAADPYLYFHIVCRWRGGILGVVPRRSTLVDHTTKLLEDEETKIARAERQRRPSQATRQPQASAESTQGQNGTAETQEEEIPTVTLTQRQQWLEEALDDPALDDDAKALIREALEERSPGQRIAKAILRMTNTFPVSRKTGRYIVPSRWFYGALKGAVRRDLNVYEDKARELVRGCISISPEEIDLGTSKPDRVIEANVPLPATRPGEAQATIKRFMYVDPIAHGCEEFSIVVKVLDSAFAKEVADNVGRIFAVVGNSGLGGDRPNYGTFDVVSCEKLKERPAEVGVETVVTS